MGLVLASLNSSVGSQRAYSDSRLAQIKDVRSAPACPLALVSHNRSQVLGSEEDSNEARATITNRVKVSSGKANRTTKVSAGHKAHNKTTSEVGSNSKHQAASALASRRVRPATLASAQVTNNTEISRNKIKVDSEQDSSRIYPNRNRTLAALVLASRTKASQVSLRLAGSGQANHNQGRIKPRTRGTVTLAMDHSGSLASRFRREINLQIRVESSGADRDSDRETLVSATH